jgi:glycosyltransferase involved in cell wall biosynthesis
MPIRLAFNATALLSPLTGIGQYAKALADELVNDPDVEPAFFYARYWSRSVRERPVESIEGIKQLIKRFIPNSYALSRQIQQLQFSNGIRRLMPAVYHEPNYLPFHFDGPTVVTVHDASWVRLPETHPADRVAAMERFFPQALRRGSLFLTDSVFVQRELVEIFGVDIRRIRPILLGVGHEFRPRSKAECLAVMSKFGLEYQRYVLTVGTLEPRKNLKTAIKAFAILPEALQKKYPLVMVGMRGWHTNEIDKLLRPLIEKGRVIVPGYVDRESLIALMAGARAFAYPSIYEGFGLPVLESMACGVPPITSNVTSLPEVVGDAGIMIAPHDVDALADALRCMLENDVLRDSLSQRALLRAKSFSWRKCAVETIAAYREVSRS